MDHALVDGSSMPSTRELTVLALLADPDAPIADDAVPLDKVLLNAHPTAPLPDWYMPSPAGVIRARKGWPRVVAMVLVLAFLAVDIAGLCNTYGLLQLA